ncbi:MAG: hypothetical protein WAO19_11660, partial [Candidatus Kryptoniota bacterium]
LRKNSLGLSIPAGDLLILDRFQDETNNDTIAACQDHATSIGNSSQKRKPWLPKPPISDS